MLAFILLAALSLIEARPSRPMPSFHFGGMVIGGTNANPGEFPWQLSQTRGGSHSCGASLLDSMRALSAAHCVDGADPATLGIIAGLHDRSGTPGSVSVSVPAFTMHAEYNVGSATFANDIAIIWFGSGITAGGNIAYATLPADNSNNYAGQTCVISGWGRTSTSQALPNTLQKASIGVLTTAECTTNLQGVGSAWDNHICLFDPSGAVGSCNGDSGGPLNCVSQSVVAGVTSWGVSSSGNCLQSHPSVYTRTSAYLAWIAAN
jgi:secreted trypsin-like serine protease